MLALLHGDALTQLKTLESESVQTCVTSPPYWGLRDYGTGQWIGGENECPHLEPQGGTGQASAKQNTSVGSQIMQYKSECRDCGARRVDIQIGLEKTPEAYVAALLDVFREVKRVLRNDGTLWLNLGDTYFGGNWRGSEAIGTKQATNKGSNGTQHSLEKLRIESKTHDILKPKDLIGVPWRVAFALQADGWYLRSDIIWSKPNPMPESVTDRPTKAHEYIFLLAKSERYYYDAQSIAEPQTSSGEGGFSDKLTLKTVRLNAPHKPSLVNAQNDGVRNKRSVWTVATQPFSEAHFATFPPALITPCILAGSKAGDTVLDPFAGSGTTGKVAIELGRKAVLIEPKAEYVEMIERRCKTTIGLPLAV